LAIVLAALAVGREQLHYVPGSGHVTRVGRLFLRSGLPQLKDAPCADWDGRPIARSASRPFPIRDSGTCPICKEHSKMQMAGAAVDFGSPPSFLEKVGAARAPVLDHRCVHSFQPRAPPAA
jgi:hypothetical protein